MSLKSKFEGPIPAEDTVNFEQAGNAICIIAQIPIFSDDYDTKSDSLVKIQFGFLVAVRKLDRAFLTRMVNLTGMKINIFTNQGLSIGSLGEYTALKSAEIKSPRDGGALPNRDVLLSDVELGNEDFFQGVLPLFGAGEKTGAIAALLSSGHRQGQHLADDKAFGYCISRLHTDHHTRDVSVLEHSNKTH